jgi:hypothetical protein
MYFYDPAYGPWKINKAQAGVLFGVLGVVRSRPSLLGLYLAVRRYKPRIHRFALEWLLGKRLWLAVGLVMHIGIDLLMNVGTFVQVMIAVYIAWLSGPEIDAFWHWIVSKPQPPGVGTRPRRTKRWQAALLAPIDRLRYRTPPPPYIVVHNPGEDSVRHAALLRMWDLSDRLQFAADPAVAPRQLCVDIPGCGRRTDAAAGRALVRLLPGFWWMYPWCLIPGLSQLCGLIVTRTFR